MTRYKFMKKNAAKYTAALLTSIYGLTLVSPQVVKADVDEGKAVIEEKTVEGEIVDVTDQLTRELEVNAKDVANPEIIPAAEGELRKITNTDTLSSEELTVTVDTEFPNIVEYRMGDKVIKGANKSRDEFLINGKIFKPTVQSEKVSEDSNGESYLYRLNFEDINVEMIISLTIVENTVKLQFEEINENGDFRVGTMQIPNHNLVTINEEEENSDITAAKVHGILSSDDYFYDLKEKEVDKSPVNQTMAFLNNGDLVASLENNVIDYEKQVYYQTVLNEGVKEAGLWNGSWIYREQLSNSDETNIKFSGVTELPWSRVVISSDQNNDEVVDWQDGAIAYREHMVKPYGDDVVKDHVSHVAMNFASQAQYPFDRLTDQVAKYSNYLDGFGQMMLVKGYQSEGHDSAHPDYGNNFNQRAGGVEEFNEMAKVVEEKYNTLVGVHINTTELYPEAKYFLDELLEQPYRKGWKWLDQSYYVDKRADVLNETETGLKARLDELKEATSELDWVYVDVYRTNPWNEYMLQNFLMDNDWYVATEWSGPMRKNAIWTHWADLTYDGGNISNGVNWGEQYRGTRSKVVRFVENEMKDVFPNDILLKGNKNKGFMGWEGDAPREKNIEYSVETFYNWTLPTKYMQHFPIIKWTDTEATFENNLVSSIENLNKDQYGKVIGGDTKLEKDGNLIYSGTTYRNGSSEGNRAEDAGDKLLSKDNRVFIPYSETDIENPDKVYAWNDFDEERTWHLPKSWKEEGTSKVYLYETSGEGRRLVEEIPVVDGQITLNLNPSTPYIIYNEKVEETIGTTEWSETSSVGDMGFDSYDFKDGEDDSYGWWSKTSEGDGSNVSFERETGVSEANGSFTNNTGQTYLRIDGEEAGGVTQNITLKGGKDYSASVWAEITPGKEREAEIEVKVGDEVFKQSITSTNFRNFTVNSDKHNTYFQRIKVDFTVPEGVNEIQVSLNAGEGESDSYVRFDNVRVVEHKMSEEEKTSQNENYYYEDFESVDEGWGPFVYGYNGSCQTHLSERNINGYTNDTINGDWSFKTQEGGSGLVARTVPGLLKLEPNKKYSIKLDYKFPDSDFYKGDKYGNYDIAVKSDKAKGSEEETVMRARLDRYEINEETGQGSGTFEYTFETGSQDDYYIAIEKVGNGILVLDDLTINEYDGEVDNPFPEPPKPPVDPLAIPQEKMSIVANAEQSDAGGEGPARYALDGNEGTIWHTPWDGSGDKPYHVTLDLDKEGDKSYVIDTFTYLPRQSGGNGRITQYELQVSNDGENFTTVSTGKWANDEELKVVKFDAVEATHVKLIALEGVGGYASAAEINVKQKEVPVEPEIIVNPVREFKEFEVNKKDVTVTWVEPETTEGLEGYILYKDGKKVDEISKEETSYIFKKLNRHTIYNFKIAAKYSNGEISSKESITLRTAR
ncbi:endo-alpha-N-acetylgalactosaminidase family protein [Clostridium sp. LIBA-8841]|uniref:endo-alpha-N-acetylgalactosaminidase family protein n=1 Tax=Clostridium sp. LIBA-8841 TaxID=2987530 RepID=UPI002AC5DBD1|nr:endo-alpha-N-acetylgalactosaminidase family protein [Clostridium sp. LIBA-8841]MDZ5252090.1 endo-alpha-N-acetylgalactosaminidase family protein [Clostridium sp. LIBA-8841]